MRFVLTLCALSIVTCAAAEDGPVKRQAAELTFKDNAAIPKGGQTTILFGDPKAASPIVYRVKLPPNYKLPPHTHAYQETVTVLSGKVGAGFGPTLETKGPLEEPGALLVVPANQPHYYWTESEGVTFQVQAVGPVGITYINPADDPRSK